MTKIKRKKAMTRIWVIKFFFKIAGVEICLLIVVLPVISTSQLRRYEKRMMCKDGDAHDKLFPDDFRFTCKPGPGRFAKCSYHYQSLKKSFHCPGFGYVSGWHVVGLYITVKCCNEPGLYYSDKNCRNHFNNDVAEGRFYRVDKGKVITGFKSFDGGVTYFNKECFYNNSPNRNVKAVFGV